MCRLRWLKFFCFLDFDNTSSQWMKPGHWCFILPRNLTGTRLKIFDSFQHTSFWKQIIPYSRDGTDNTSEIIIQERSEMYYNWVSFAILTVILISRLILDRFSLPNDQRTWKIELNVLFLKMATTLWNLSQGLSVLSLVNNSGCSHTIFFRFCTTIDRDQSIRYSWYSGLQSSNIVKFSGKNWFQPIRTLNFN